MRTAFQQSTLSSLNTLFGKPKTACARRIKRRIRFSPLRCSSERSQPDNNNQTTLPKPGQVVLTPGRWADEDGAGIVENVRFVQSRGTHVVDVVQLRRVRDDIFEKGSRALGKSQSKWYDIDDVRLVSSPVYLSGQDAYRLPEVRNGYSIVQPLDDDAKQRADAEYIELKNYMLKTTTAFGAFGTIVSALAIDIDHGKAFGCAALTSLIYLAMLQAKVDNVGGRENFLRKVLYLRFVVPVLPFMYLAKTASVSGTSFWPLNGGIPKGQVAAIFAGLLSYKVPLFLKTGKELLDGLARIEPGSTGMLGTSLSLTARAIQRRGSESLVNASDQVAAGSEEVENIPSIVFAGPSGSGKSTLMEKLELDYPQAFDYSVSHTTREPRQGETDGDDYFFVDAATFEKMISEGKFIEYARVHGYYYGTSVASVLRVQTSGKVCLLDLNIEGIEALRKMENLQIVPRFVWVAPPSFEVLEARLRNRGSETEASMKTRLDTAKREVMYAASSKIFDLTIINEDIDASYAELQSFLRSILPESVLK